MEKLKRYKYKTGLLCGRFYPYHLGHKAVIETALKSSSQVYILVCERDEQTIRAAERIAWIKDSFKDNPRVSDIFLYTLDQAKLGIPDRGASIWAKTAEDIIGFTPDAVFTSEPYQKDYADCLKADLVLVDTDRKSYAVSATKIRNRIPGYEKFLEAHVLESIQGKQLAHDQ